MYREYHRRQLPTKCPWCGEEITTENHLLTNDFGDFSMDFGCDKCITRPLEDLTPPPDFKDPRNDPVVYEAIQGYRTAMAEEERKSGRIK